MYCENVDLKLILLFNKRLCLIKYIIKTELYVEDGSTEIKFE